MVIPLLVLGLSMFLGMFVGIIIMAIRLEEQGKVLYLLSVLLITLYAMWEKWRNS